MDQETLNKLYEDFVIEVKPGKGAFKYVRTRHILDRMNRTFDGNWGTHIISHSEIGDEILILAAVYIYDDAGNIIAQQQGFGSAKKFSGVELGNTYKSATSKAIKSAVRNWGVALFLEEGEIIEPSVNTSGVQTGKAPSAMPNFTNTVQSQAVPSMPSMPSMPSSGKPPVEQSTMSMPSTPVQDVPKMPSMPNISSSTTTQTGSLPSMPVATPEASVHNEGNAQESITHVQKVAIMSRLAGKGKTFEEICMEFYADRPAEYVDSIDKMSYHDALALVSFLNTK